MAAALYVYLACNSYSRLYIFLITFQQLENVRSRKLGPVIVLGKVIRGILFLGLRRHGSTQNPQCFRQALENGAPLYLMDSKHKHFQSDCHEDQETCRGNKSVVRENERIHLLPKPERERVVSRAPRLRVQVE